ncbi:DUF2202 domain-containing protein [Opitutus sp. ER46]|uniref:DUF2202 domain-containing protein n=1 Tax=Opitutus sp. ER46 TaxID=2161864 RepID=UPI001304FC73|nr:DUF2202 domain-containing protein [Opitutus sp. ER46]
MKTKLALLLLTPALVFAAPARQGQGAGAGSPANPNPVRPDCPLNTVTAATPTTLPVAALVGAVEEERMARDLYLAAAAKWDLPMFTRIAQAEARHEVALVRLATTANVSLPAAQAGVYTSANLGELHTALMALVNESATGALKAGALLEETDIRDLRQLQATATDDPTRAVLANLERASGHHLAALTRTLASQGITYAPQILAAADYSAVIATPGQGRSQRRGPGRGLGLAVGNGVCDGTGPGSATCPVNGTATCPVNGTGRGTGSGTGTGYHGGR